MGVGKHVATAMNRVLAPLDLRLVRWDGQDWSDTANFIPFERTRAEAERAGLSIGDYVEKKSGTSRATIDHMDNMGVFSRPLDGVVEVGPGTGRYLERCYLNAGTDGTRSIKQQHPGVNTWRARIP